MSFDLHQSQASVSKLRLLRTLCYTSIQKYQTPVSNRNPLWRILCVLQRDLYQFSAEKMLGVNIGSSLFRIPKREDLTPTLAANSQKKLSKFQSLQHIVFNSAGIRYSICHLEVVEHGSDVKTVSLPLFHLLFENHTIQTLSCYEFTRIHYYVN